jgi:chorismate mutase
VFRDQIDATVSLQYSLFGDWKVDPAAAPDTAPDLASTRTTIDGLNQTMVSEIARQWPALQSPSCRAEVGASINEVVVNRGLDPLYRRALEYATHDYCR